MHKRRILIDGRLLSNHNTGISRYTKELIKSYIDRYGASNVKVIINPNFKPEKDIRYIITKLKPYNIFHFFLFYFVLKKNDFDLFHSPFYASSFIKPSNKIYIVTVHDLMYRIIDDYFSSIHIINFLAVKYYDFIVKRSLQNTDVIVSVSRATAEDLKSTFNATSIIIREGVNKFKKNGNSNEFPDKVLKKFNVSKQDFFLYVGNLRRQKNIPFLIRSFGKARTKRKLLILGNYTRENIPKEFRGSDRIYFGGYVADDDLSVLYKNCTAFIFPSLFEGFGLPILEALSYGAKVISSNSGALKEFPETVVDFFNPTEEKELISLIEKIDESRFNQDLVEKILHYYDWQNAFAEMHEAIESNLERFEMKNDRIRTKNI